MLHDGLDHDVERVLVLVGKWNGGIWVVVKTGMPAAVEWHPSLAPQHWATVYSWVVIEAALELERRELQMGCSQRVRITRSYSKYPSIAIIDNF